MKSKYPLVEKTISVNFLVCHSFQVDDRTRTKIALQLNSITRTQYVVNLFWVGF